MNMKLKQCLANRHVLRSASAIIPVLIILLMMSLPVLSSAAYGSVISQSDSFYVADEADVISSDTEKYIIEKNAELENLCGGQIVVVTVDFLDGMDIEDYAYKLFKEWEIGDEDRENGVLLLLAIGEENYWCTQGKGLEGALTSGDIDDILWNYLEDDFAAGDYDSGVRSVFDELYDNVADIYGGIGEYDGSGSGSSDYDYDYDYASAASSFARIIKMVLIVFLVVLVLLIITSIFFGRRNRSSRGGSSSGGDYDWPQYDRAPYDSSRRSRNRTRPIFIPTSRPSRPSGSPRSSRPARTSRTSSSGSRPSSSRSSFGGGSRSSSRGGGMGRGGGGSSRGGGAGRRGR